MLKKIAACLRFSSTYGPVFVSFAMVPMGYDLHTVLYVYLFLWRGSLFQHILINLRIRFQSLSAQNQVSSKRKMKKTALFSNVHHN